MQARLDAAPTPRLLFITIATATTTNTPWSPQSRQTRDLCYSRSSDVLGAQVLVVHGHVVVGILAVRTEHADDEEENHTKHHSHQKDGDKQANDRAVAGATGGVNGRTTVVTAEARVAEALRGLVRLVEPANTVATAQVTVLTTEGALNRAAVDGVHLHEVVAVAGLVGHGGRGDLRVAAAEGQGDLVVWRALVVALVAACVRQLHALAGVALADQAEPTRAAENVALQQRTDIISPPATTASTTLAHSGSFRNIPWG